MSGGLLKIQRKGAVDCKKKVGGREREREREEEKKIHSFDLIKTL